MKNEELVKSWQDKINRAEKKYKEYADLVDETRAFYKAGKNGKKSLKADNIFWSGIETQKPFLYFKRPKPYLERVNKIASPVEQVACKILERALEWDLSQFDFDSMAKYVRNDYLISGCGILWEQYMVQTRQVEINPGVISEEKEDEVVLTTYVDPKEFLIDTDKVGIWEKADWIAKKIFMTKSEVIEQFGEKAQNLITDFTVSDKENDWKKEICVYEVWDKTTRCVYWLVKESPHDFLKVVEDPLKLNNFFPCPKPIFATLTNDSLIPVPDYMMIKKMLDELNGVTERMRLTMQALKVSGVYDNSFHNLGDIFEKDITLVSLSDFDKLKNAGGIKGVIDFVPIDQYITALQALAQRRDDLTQQIFDITGVSDIMRGNADPNETATAVSKKTNFGTLRNQDRQNDMQRFICDLYRIKAEIICEMFDAVKLAAFIQEQDGYDPQLVMEAISLLKTDKMRGMILNIETDVVFNQEQEAQKTLESVQTLSKMIAEALPVVSQQKLLLPLYKQMVSAVVSTVPHARLFESVLEKTFSQIEAELNQPPTPVQPPVDPRIEIESKKVQNQYEVDKEKNALKAREIDIKQQAEEQKLALTNKEMELQADLKAAQIAKEAEGVNTNIPTGYVKAF